MRRAVWTSPVLWFALWGLSRLWVLRDYLGRWHAMGLANDVRYYFQSLTMPGLGDQRLIEYPVPVVWFLDLLRLFATNAEGYLVVFGISMAVLDLVMLVLLWRTGRVGAVLFWIAFVHGYGSLVWFRYDLLPALAVGLAALWVTSHPRRSGAMIAWGASLKLWPALLILPLAGRHRSGRLRMATFAVVGALMALLAFAAGGWDRLLSPLTWQDDRGLQIESIPATVLMWKHAFSTPGVWTVAFSQYNAFEVFGPGTDFWLKVATVSMAVVVLMALAMGVVAWTRRSLPADALTLCIVALVAGMLVANKTFSPQYLIWLGAPLAALLAQSHRRIHLKATILAVIGVVLAALTREVYPVRYGGLVGRDHGDQGDTMVLVVRNLLLIVFWLLSSLWAWQLLLSDPAGRRTVNWLGWSRKAG